MTDYFSKNTVILLEFHGEHWEMTKTNNRCIQQVYSEENWDVMQTNNRGVFRILSNI